MHCVTAHLGFKLKGWGLETNVIYSHMPEGTERHMHEMKRSKVLGPHSNSSYHKNCQPTMGLWNKAKSEWQNFLFFWIKLKHRIPPLSFFLDASCITLTYLASIIIWRFIFPSLKQDFFSYIFGITLGHSFFPHQLFFSFSDTPNIHVRFIHCLL